MAYTIGIRRRWLPGYTKKLVLKHETETKIAVGEKEYEILPRLILTRQDGSLELISNILNRDWIVYSDFFKEPQNGAEVSRTE